MAKRDVYVDLDLHGNAIAAGNIASNGVPLWADFKTSALQGYLTPFPVPTYTSGRLTQTKLYTDSTLSTLLLTTDLAYTSGRLTQVKYTNGRTGATLTKPFSYDGSGNILPGQGVIS